MIGIILFIVVMIVVFLVEGKYHLPISWRIKSPKWDKFLCKIGSHRCYTLCGMGCCWGCRRCEAEEKGQLEEHYTRALELLANAK